ncbi:MAG TPA: cysteine desulfurase family protein [Bdellovibrionota bacterium]|nr:cysteine desulfurase family protein [Bdellovibrionota bacterium]
MPKADRRVYLDSAATTLQDARVTDAMADVARRQLGNASSIHALGVEAAVIVERSRAVIAQSIGADPSEIVFVSGGTEANALALLGSCGEARARKRVIVSAIEHSSVLATARFLEERLGLEVVKAPVDAEGHVRLDALSRLLTPEVILCSIMHANNEVGSIQDIRAIAELAKAAGALFHVDACQSFTKTPLDVRAVPADLVTLTAHKIHGPRGVGALYVRAGTRLAPLFHGGGQENGLRSGTLNTEGIAGFAEAVRIARDEDVHRMEKLRDRLIHRVLEAVPGSRLNGPPGGSGTGRLCSNASFSFGGVSAKRILFELDRAGFSVSAGSACSSGSTTPSHVLLAMGLSEEAALGSIRVSLSRLNAVDEIDSFVLRLAAAVERERHEHAPNASL